MVERVHWDEDKIDTFHASKKKSIPKEEANKAEVLDAKYEKIDITKVIKNQTYLIGECEILCGILEAKVKCVQR